ncbi:uncharacterized protein [Anolis sagrei]|uniref:uncharacterized protein n=1 Tax=Anolis sagrei TaxID=38937 RepID=UPI0035215D83
MCGRIATRFKISPFGQKASYELPDLIECSLIPRNKEQIATKEVVQAHPHLKGIQDLIPALDLETDIVMIIGADCPILFRVSNQIEGPKGSPIAQKLPLGWTVLGPVCLNKMFQPVTKRPSLMQGCASHISVCCQGVIPDYSSIFEVTERDEQTAFSKDEQRFLEMMNNQVTQDLQGNWIAPLPFKPERPSLPNNRDVALHRLLSLRRRMLKDPKVKTQITQFVEDLFSSNYAEPATACAEEEEETDGGPFSPQPSAVMMAVLSPRACDSDPATPAAQSLKDVTEEKSNDGSQPSKRRRMSSENNSQSYETSSQDLSFSYFAAENLIEYKWPPDEMGVYYMLQEQVSEYLGVISFKRKYPDLESRDLSHKEKLYLGELNVSEGECGLENQEEPLSARLKARERNSTPRKERSKRSVSKSVPGYKPKTFSNAICGICLKRKESNKKGKTEALIHCSQCESSGHPSCLDMSAELLAIIKTYPWQCLECKTCIICGQPHHEEEMIFCDASTKAIAAVAYDRQRGISTCSPGFVMSKTKVAPMDFSVPRRELCAAVLATQLRQTVREEIT